jgi:hypothetical protein
MCNFWKDNSMTKKTVAKVEGASPEDRIVPVQGRQYTPTESELKGLEQIVASKGYRIRSNGDSFDFDHPDQVCALAGVTARMGAKDTRFSEKMITDVVNLGDPKDEQSVHFRLAVIDSVQPREPLEAMLALQMAVVHEAIVTTAGRLKRSESVERSEIYSRMLNQQTRTFATQLEALHKYRNQGEQRITVQHVQVNSGGQAIVGDITTGGPREKK